MQPRFPSLVSVTRAIEGVALWVGPGTEGYFSNLKITAR